MSKSNSRVRRSFTAEYKAQAVELVRAGGKSAGQVAKDLDLAGSALRDWVKQADDVARTGKLVDEDERAELKRLREENRNLPTTLRQTRFAFSDFLPDRRARNRRTAAQAAPPSPSSSPPLRFAPYSRATMTGTAARQAELVG